MAEIEHQENLNIRKLAKLKQKDGYDYNKPGSLTLAYRVPENMVGDDLRNATKYTQIVNKELQLDQQFSRTKSEWSKSAYSTNKSRPSNSPSSFPRTTNQEFNEELEESKSRQRQINQRPPNKFNHKKISQFSSYVDATFNTGIY